MSGLIIVIAGLLVWWAFVAWDRMTGQMFGLVDKTEAPEPCPACGQTEDEVGDYRCPVCRRTRSIYRGPLKR